MTHYAPHELALVFPPMTESEFAAFKDDIREHGQHEPITLYEGKILDGLHRYRACQELGREPSVVRFAGNPRAAAQLVLGRNFHRRHLTTSQRAIVAAEMCKLRPRGNTGNSPYLTAAQASTLMGVSEDLVRDAKRLLRHGDEDLLQAVREGVQTVSGAVQEKDRKKNKAQTTFLEQFAQRLDRALQGHNQRDAQVVCAAKPLLEYLTAAHPRLPRAAVCRATHRRRGAVLWDPAELRGPTGATSIAASRWRRSPPRRPLAQGEPGRSSRGRLQQRPDEPGTEHRQAGTAEATPAMVGCGE